MAARTPPARARKPAPRKAAPRKAAPRKAPVRRPTATRARPSTSSVAAPGLGRGVGALWMGVAHSVGWVARGVGKQAATAKDIDPEHRRDGAGLLLLGLSILVAVGVWVGSAGPGG